MMKDNNSKKSKDGINYNENVKNGKPFWFQIMVNGKRVTRRGFRTFGEAKIARANVVSELSRDEYIAPTKTSFGEFFIEWVDGRQNVEDSTIRKYHSFYEAHIKDLIGDRTLSKLTPQDIKQFITNLRKKGLSDGSVKRIFSTVNASLNYAESMDIIKKNPANKIPKHERPVEEHKEREIWNNDSIKYVLYHSKGTTRFWMAFFLAVMTGMRQGEILGLKWSDIDFERSILRVRRSLESDKANFKKVKTKKSERLISLSPLTIAALLEHRDIIDQEKIAYEAKGFKYQDHNLVVCSSKGTPTRASKVLGAWYTACTKFKPDHEPWITFHDLRHQSASMMLNEKEDIRVVSERLGHSTVTTTLRVYSHLLPDSQKSAALSIDRVLGHNLHDDKIE